MPLGREEGYVVRVWERAARFPFIKSVADPDRA